jgi:hypothetical protein
MERSMILLFTAFNLVYSTSNDATITKVSLRKYNSETLPGNLLPNFLFMQGAIEGGSVGVNIGGGRGKPKVIIPNSRFYYYYYYYYYFYY